MSISPFLDWTIALAPVLVMIGLFVWLDVFKLMNASEIAALLLLGALAAAAAYPISGRLLDALPLGFSNYSRFVAPWIEEALKALVVIALFAFNRIGFKLDAAISGFTVGAGFALLENSLYLLRFDGEMGTGVWMVRGLGTAIMHGGTVAILASLSHEFAERETRDAASGWRMNPLWFVPGYLIAVGVHVAFNQFPDRPLLAMLGAVVLIPLMLMAILHFGAAEAQTWLEAESEGHRDDLAALREGRFPDSETGRRIAALAARSGEAQGEQIRHYLELHTWLVLQAEKALLRADGDPLPDQLAVAFRHLKQLRRTMGRATFATLKPLLPFSRNDLWEMSELEQRVKRAS